MTYLNSNQLKQYQDDGYVAPINAINKDEANEIRKEIEFIENKWPDELKGSGRNYVHLISSIFDKIAHNNNILNAVESLIGKNILIVVVLKKLVDDPVSKSPFSELSIKKYGSGMLPHSLVTILLHF